LIQILEVGLKEVHDVVADEELLKMEKTPIMRMQMKVLGYMKDDDYDGYDMELIRKMQSFGRVVK
jgi:hypothetical protein